MLKDTPQKSQNSGVNLLVMPGQSYQAVTIQYTEPLNRLDKYVKYTQIHINT